MRVISRSKSFAIALAHDATQCVYEPRISHWLASVSSFIPSQLLTTKVSSAAAAASEGPEELTPDTRFWGGCWLAPTAECGCSQEHECRLPVKGTSNNHFYQTSGQLIRSCTENGDGNWVRFEGTSKGMSVIG